MVGAKSKLGRGGSSPVCLAVILGFFFAVVTVSVAMGQEGPRPLPEALTELLSKHKLVRAARADVEAAKERAQAALGGWYPRLDVLGHYGHENQNNFSVADTSLVTRELDITVTQLLWDFGLTNSTVRVARLLLDQAQATLDAVQQDVLLRAITAHLNVRRAAEVLRFAKESEGNIKRQTELESARIERGAGLSTDVLQAKVQLAGAEARRIQSEGALEVAMNGYRAVFYEPPPPPEQLEDIKVPEFLLPANVEEAVQLALEGNPQLRAASVGTQVAEENIKTTRANEFFPTLEAIGSLKYKKDVGGTVGFEVEKLAKIQLSWPFNLGFTAVNTLRASKRDFTANAQRVADLRDQVEQQARDAWANLQTARRNAELLRNQAVIAAEFLELARKERQLGQRSLIDVLAGETALINANSDAASAETDVQIASFTLLAVMGQLSLEVITEASQVARR